MPLVVDAAAPALVLASGGIADGRGLAAALMLGADGAWIGTRLVATDESGAHEGYKARLVAAGATETVRTDLSGPETPQFNPMRVLRNIVTGSAARTTGLAGPRNTPPFSFTSAWMSLHPTRCKKSRIRRPAWVSPTPTATRADRRIWCATRTSRDWFLLSSIVEVTKDGFTPTSLGRSTSSIVPASPTI